MITIVGVAGSLRRGSYNAAVLRAAAELVPEDCRIQIESIAGIPLYDGDVEAAEGVPAVVARIKDAVGAADGLLLVTPEYNNSMPGVAKNAIDWMTRPPADIPRVFGGKPVALCGASPGGFGTVLAQNAWLPVLRTVGAELWTGGRLLVSRAATLVDANGNITDATTRESIRKFVHGFVAHVRTRGTAASA